MCVCDVFTSMRALTADYQEMCRFASPTDETYEKLYKRMGRIIEVYAEHQVASQCM